jgi:hypothetical protein
MSRTKSCRNDEHVWKPHGSKEKCVKCGTMFPCNECEHLDCMDARMEPWPEWVTNTESQPQDIEWHLEDDEMKP